MDEFGGDLHALGRSSLLRLEAVRGIGPARAVSIAAAMELGRRRMARPDSPAMRVTRSEDIVRRFRSRLIDRSEEEFWALALNRANGALADLRMSIGGQSGTVVDPKVVFSQGPGGAGLRPRPGPQPSLWEIRGRASRTSA